MKLRVGHKLHLACLTSGAAVLSLAICKLIVEVRGGRIGAAS